MSNSIRDKILKDYMAQICNKCNQDLYDIRLYLKYRYNLPNGTDMSKIMKIFKKIVFDKTECIVNNKRMKELLKKIGE